VRFERLARGHVVAAVAALVLLLVMAMTWYGSHQADLAHQVSGNTSVSGADAGVAGRAIRSDADAIIARDEKNAWQESRTLDRIILVMLLLTIALALFTAAHRAAGRRAEPPWTPSAVTALSAAVTALLVAYRIVNQPGNNANTTVKLGAPLGIVMLALVGLGAASAFKGEANFAEMRRAASAPASPEAAPEPAEPSLDAP
jgi:hypothetical protein